MAKYKTIKTLPTSAFANTDSAHYNIPLQTRWFMQSGNWITNPKEFKADIGNTGQTWFVQNISDSNAARSATCTDPFWSYRDGTDLDRGFRIEKQRTSLRQYFNVELSGGSGAWMPVSLVNSISFKWKNTSNNGSNWAPHYIGLKVRNAITGATKRWSSGASFSNVDEAINKIYRVYNRSEFYELRGLGPEWFVYGLLFNFRSPSTSYLGNALCLLTDYRIGWYAPTSSGGNRIICPREINWNDFSRLYREEGIRYYQ